VKLRRNPAAEAEAAIPDPGGLGNSGSDRVRAAIARIPRQTVFWIAVLDIVAITVFGALTPNHVFFTLEGVKTLAVDSAELVILSGASMLLLGARRFDISIGANLGLASVVATMVMRGVGGVNQVAELGVTSSSAGDYHNLGQAVALGVLAGILSGVAVGLANGLIVVKLRVNSLVATLGMLSIVEGITYVLTNGTDLSAPTQLQTSFGLLNIAGLPVPAVIAAVIAVVLWLVVAKTGFGMRTLAIGSARDAALRSGINVERHEIVLFTLAGALAGTAALLDISRFAFTNAAGHPNDALAAISAAVIGGAAITGGVISVPGAVLGVLLTTILEVGLVLMELPSYYQLVAIGMILITAVYVDQRRRRAV